MTTYLLKQLDYHNNTEWRLYFIFLFTLANCTVLFITLFVGIAANLFVVWAVIRQKSLQTSNNALLVNLAIIDFIQCTVDCSLLMTIEMRGYGIGHPSALLCDAQLASFSFSCCVQLLTLASISVERYQAIANPFQNKERRIRIMVWIPLTWTLALLVTVWCMNHPRDAPTYLKCSGIGLHTDTIPEDTLGRYILIPIWSGCFSVIIGFYGRIFWIVKTHNKKIFDKGVSPPKNTLQIAVDDGKTADDKSNTLEEPASKKTEIIKPEMQKEGSPPVAAVTQYEATETKELLPAENTQIITPGTSSLTPQPTVIMKNHYRPTQSSPKIENKTGSASNRYLHVANTRRPETVETEERASVREGPLQAKTAKVSTGAIPVISLDATTSNTLPLKVITNDNSQLTPPRPKAISACESSPPMTSTEHPDASETGERVSIQIVKSETAEITAREIPSMSLEATTSRIPSDEVIMKDACQPATPSIQMEKTMVSFEANASVPTMLMDRDGCTKTAQAPDPKSTINVKVEEVQPLPPIEAPNTDAQPNPPAAQHDQEAAGAVCMMSPAASRERASKKKEGKVAKRSGYIILTFIIFWTPLIVCILVNFFASKHDNTQVWIAMEFEILAVSVACMTSATNPITYAAVNPQFRTEFRKLKAKYKKLKKRLQR